MCTAGRIGLSVSSRSNFSNGFKYEGHPIDAGSSGENLTLTGLEWDFVGPGVRLSVGSEVRLAVTSYTAPCSHNAPWFRDGDYQRISQKRNPGWSRVYAKVLREGVVRPGDRVKVEKAT